MSTHQDHVQDLDLEPLAVAIDLEAGDLGRVIARSRQRQRRTTIATSIVAAVALLGTTGAITRYATTRGDDHGNLPVAATGGGSALVPGDVPMRWTRVDPKSGLGFSRSTTEADQTRPLYAISTGPGQTDTGKANPSRVVWRSEDGIEWTAASTMTNDLYLSDLATAGNRIYAVGTTAAQRATNAPALIVGWSDDDAKSWERANVDLDLAAIAAVSKHVSVVASDIASGKQGTVAAVVVSAELDVPKVLPAGASAPYGWVTTATGVDVLGRRDPDANPCPNRTTLRKEGDINKPQEVYPVTCFEGDEPTGKRLTPQEVQGVTASFTWDQLGIRGDVLGAVRRQPIAFYAASGSTVFERVATPATPPTFSVMLQATDDGFDLIASSLVEGMSTGSPLLLQSADGKRWAADAEAIGHDLEWVTAMGRIDGRVAIIGAGPGGAVLARRTGAGSWTATPLTSIVDPAVAKGGVAYANAAAIGPLGAVAVLSVVDPEGKERSNGSHRLVVTRDGTTWSDVNLDDVAGRTSMGSTRVAIVGDKALVTVVLGDGKSDARDHLVLVGSPA